MRALWVVGAKDKNLGHEVVQMALPEFWGYDLFFPTDEQTADVTSLVHLEAHCRKMKDAGATSLHIAYCAGVNLLDAIPSVTDMDLNHTYEVNVMGFIRVLQAALVHFPNRGMSVVAVGSDAARTPMRNSIAYCSSKAALVQAVRVAARELAPEVRVNCVSPAIIADTPMTWAIDKAVQIQRGWTEEEALTYERSLIPMRRRAYKSEVADVILNTLAGPEFLTGSNIEITGGK